MRAIDADELKKCVLKWLPRDPCGIEEREMPFETDICVSMLMEIDEQPTIQPEPHWIPVTEEPTDRMICYVTLKDTNDENRQNWVAEMIYTPWDGFDLMDGIEAIAWMPKQYPEPYKEVTDGRD